MSTSVANLPLYLQPWWWDAATGNSSSWAAAEVKGQEGQLLAYWPYYQQRRLLGMINIASLPPLTMHSGPWVSLPPEGSGPARAISRNWKLQEELLSQLPQPAFFRAKAPYNFTNGMPLQRDGWKEEVKYSYQLPTNQSSIEHIKARFAPHVRQQIKKAAAILKISRQPQATALLELMNKAYQARGQKASHFPKEAFMRLHKAAQQQQASVSWLAKDEQGQNHAALWMAYDTTTTYAILPAAAPQLRASGAMSLLLWQGIQWAQSQGLIFDFEGSSIPGVEEFYRGFGPELRSYSMFSKKAFRLF